MANDVNAYHFTPLQYVTESLAAGSRSELARMLQIHRSTVSGWDNPVRRSEGMAGTIPAEYLPKIMALAGERGIALDAAKLIPKAVAFS